MLPTPSTDHVTFENVYEPAEDSFLLLDTLSSRSEREFLRARFPATAGASPVVLEIGTGSGVVLAFVAANALHILGRSDIMTVATDINSFACHATKKTLQLALASNASENPSAPVPIFLDSINSDLASPLRAGSLDVLIFNPPYVPTEGLPDLSKHDKFNAVTEHGADSFDCNSHMLALSYAGGVDGMEVTNRLLGQIPTLLRKGEGVAYILLCAQNRPDHVKSLVRQWGSGWKVETVGSSGKKAGWERLQVIRIWQ
ncbi:methyltransferase domain-containing protein [Lineolata rhizophorae]|uniref:Methyltransferase domain-containing protein n=1 Tax=Lineolata rhizophorae TaxID=578093 RepID=A0A6A6P611_9PEZI|nr:methyltransferase domain-containing protein [Lineolata rhizophorae]